MDFSQFIQGSPEQRMQELEAITSNTNNQGVNGQSRVVNTPLTREQKDAIYAELDKANKPVNTFANHIQGRITPTKDNWLGVIGPNFIRNVGDIGTGLANLTLHIPENLESLAKYEKKNHDNMIREAQVAKKMLKDGTMTPMQYIDYIGRAMYASPLVATARDTLNLVGTPYALKNTTPAEFINAAKQGGIKGVTDKTVNQAKETAKSMLESPADVLLDLTGTGIPRRILAKTPIFKAAKAGEKAESILSGKAAKIQQDLNKVNNSISEANKVAKDAGYDVADLVKRAEETGDWTGVPVEVKQKFKQFSNQYNEITKKHSPQTAVDPEHLTVAQNIARRNNISYREAEKAITAMEDSIPKELTKEKGIEFLAKNGDSLAQKVVEAKKAYKKGDLFPITHAMDDNWIIDDLEKSGRGLDDADRIYSGKFSTREYGLHKYEDIAKSLAKPDEFLTALSKQYLGNNIKNELINGTLNGKPIAALKETNNVYIPQKVLTEQGNIEKLEKVATPKRLNADDIAIDKNILKELSNQTKKIGEFFGTQWMNDLVKINKGSMLAGLTYLGANATGGIGTAILASGIHTLDDFANAIKTKGVLSKNLGVYRNTRAFTPLKTKWLNPFHQINRYTTGSITDFIDRRIQNTFAEMAAHRKMREMGVMPKDRLKTIEDMDAANLGDIIKDIKAEAMLESTKTTLPRGLIEVGAGINPFWRWPDTAARTTIHMLNKYPIASNIILNQILARIGFDNEMQQRLNLGVKSDKRNVSYFFDDRTGQIKEASIEWLPQTNTFKLISDPSSFLKDNPLAVPTLMKLYNVTKGLDQYGRPLKRADKNGIRHQPDNKTGVRWVTGPNGWVKQGSKADEILSTFAKETIGILNTANKTALPVAGTLTGKKFYQPYAQSLFGDFQQDENTNTFFAGGDPRKPRELGDVIGSFLGLYSRPYIPRLQEERTLTPRQGRSLMRANRYDMLRKQRGY